MSAFFRNYLKDETAAVGTVEMVLLTLGVISIAGFFVTRIMYFFNTSADKSSCANSNEVFCTE